MTMDIRQRNMTIGGWTIALYSEKKELVADQFILKNHSWMYDSGRIVAERKLII